MIYPTQIPQANTIHSFWINAANYKCSTGLQLTKPAFPDHVGNGFCGNQEGEYGLTWPPGAGDKVGGVPTAHGIAQWHKDRQQKIFEATGIDILTAGCHVQQWAVWWELTTVCRKCLKMINAAKDEEDVVTALVDDFEYSGDRARDKLKRTEYARKWRDFFSQKG